MRSAVALNVGETVDSGARSETAATTWVAGLLTIVGLGVGAANLLFNVVVARYGGVAAYGGASVLLAMVTGAGFLALGLQYAMARHAATRGMDLRMVWRTMVRRAWRWGMIAFAALAVAPAISSFLHLTSVLPAVTAVLLVAVVIVTAVPTGVLIGQRRFGAVALLMALPAVVRLALVFPLGRMHDVVLGALLASAVPLLAALIAAWVLVYRAGTRADTAAASDRAIDASAGQGIVSDGIVGAVLATTIWATWSLPLLFGRHDLRPSEASDLSAAQLVAGGVVFVTGSVVTAFFPSIVRGRARGTVLTGLLATVTLALAGGGVLVGLLPELAPRLYGTRFATPASLMAALSVSLLAVTTANYLLWVARALQRLLLPTAVGCALALVVETGLGAVWHPGAIVLAVEPGVALLVGLGAACTAALLLSPSRSRRLVMSAPATEHGGISHPRASR